VEGCRRGVQGYRVTPCCPAAAIAALGASTLAYTGVPAPALPLSKVMR
jgi:hypothetical protein